MRYLSLAAIGAASLAFVAARDQASAQPAKPVAQSPAERQCRAFLGRTYDGATVTRAVLVAATTTTPEYCLIRGELPVDLDFELRMPSKWIGRTVFAGGGGFDGMMTASLPVTWQDSGSYALISTNHGHNTDTTPGASFALDMQMLQDYGSLGVPRVLAAAKTILRARYGTGFDKGKIVFSGCSGGGRQGLIQAQRYPDLFDGVISRAPANAYTPQFLWYQKVAVQLAKPGAALTPGKIAAIGAAVDVKCDALDGLKDGVIGRPDICSFDPAELSCKGVETDSCLTAPQVESARTYYAPTSVAGGRYVWPGFTPGGESARAWMIFGGAYGNPLMAGFIKYMVARDPNIDPLTLDPAKYTSRLDYLVRQIDAVDPDLGAFKARGGKLLLWTGQSDWLITANNATAYYQSVVAKSGGQAAADQFVEYYTSPGVQHCMGGTGADRMDLESVMFDWLEKGVKPSSRTIIASHRAALAESFSRPLCRYPTYPKYIGGDPKEAASFVCTAP